MTHNRPVTKKSVARSFDRLHLAPALSNLLDGGFALVLCALGILGFRTTYGGSQYLVVGLLAVLFGIAIAYLANRIAQPVLSLAAVTVVVFFLFGGVVALRTTAVGGVLPTFTTVHTLSSTSVTGWKQLLTTLPPVGNSHHLLALPYALGLLGGVTTMSIAGRSKRAALPLVAPVVVLAVGILFGTAQPAALFWQGSVFAALGLTWAVLRQHRLRPSIGGSGRVGRAIGSVAVLGCACALAQPLGTHLPLAHQNNRVVLRAYTQPPFDPGAYPSPLAGFRHYVGPKSQLNDTTLFTITGLPSGARVRIATVDAYNGNVWGFGTNGTASDEFQGVGSSIPAVVQGAPATVKVTVGAYDDVWLPDAGYLTQIKFTGSHAPSLENAFRYNLSTGTAVVPVGLRNGDSYELHVLLPKVPDDTTLSGASPAQASSSVTGAPPQVATDAKEWTADKTGAYAKLKAVADYLKNNGEYSDGETADAKSPPVMPGHGTKRLADFLNGQHIVGDGEQYAATMALMANALGYPARVVFGAVPETGGTVKGKDIAAWAEVDFAGIGWVPFDATPPKSHKPQPEPPQPQQAATNTQVVPPPAVAAPPPVANPNQTSTNDKKHTNKSASRSGGFAIPGWVTTGATYGGPPIALIALLIGAIVGLKWRRGKRRRTRGPTTRRVAGAWYELVDVARDLRIAVPGASTRREQARAIGHDVSGLAKDADAAIFGPGVPAEEDVENYWKQMAAAAQRLKDGVSRWRRLRAAVSLRSLRRTEIVEPARRPAISIPRQQAPDDELAELVGQR